MDDRMKQKRLGVSFSPELMEAWKNIQDYVDVVEISNISDLYDIKENWTYHFTRTKNGEAVNLLKPEAIKKHFNREEIKNVLNKKSPEIVSLHLGYPAEVFKKGVYDYPISENVGRSEAIEKFSESLDYLTEFSEVPVAVENLDYYGNGAYEYICEPEFINELLNKNKDVYLLLDISHAEVSAVELGDETPENRLETTRKYLDKLPLERVIEIHINSPILKNNKLMDTYHLPITDVEVAILKNLLDLPNLDVVNLECKEKIFEQLKELVPLVKGK